MYGMINSVKLFDDELTNWMVGETWFNHSKCQMSLYYKYAPYRSKLVVLYYVGDYIYSYISDEIGKRFVDTFGKIFLMNFLGYAHQFMSIHIS